MTGEILTTAEMAKADAFAVAHGVPSLTLMENAGRVVAEAIAARFKPCAVTVLCGPGNNGGDGFVVARLLDESGFTVRVAHDSDHSSHRSGGDAKEMSLRWKGAREALTPAALDGAKLVVDGLFGAGLSRPLEGAPAQHLRSPSSARSRAICCCRAGLCAGKSCWAISAFRPRRPTRCSTKTRPCSGISPGSGRKVTNIPAAIAWW